jgi:two-component system sensor histidine kinase CpxA
MIVALMTFPIARRISNPIKNLTESTKKLEQGNLSHRSSVNRKDEIGELAKAFNKMAGKLERMVKSGKEMTAQVSHELRSPLARIQIAVEIVKDNLTNRNGETAGQLKNIQTDVDELDRIIGRILELSKLDLQHDVPYTEVFSPARLLSESLSRYEASFNKKKIKLDQRIESEAKIIGNKQAFLIAFNNLLDNAFKYTPTHGKVLFASSDKKDLIEILLANSGATLSDPDLRKIFNPFFRIADNGENGAGLGLSITRKIIEKHFGKISASNTDSGLEFRIQVPIVRID